MDKEMNFFDLCVLGWRALGRGCNVIGRVLARMVRLTVWYWWIAVPVVLIGLGGAYYYTRPDNLTFKVNAVALLNGPSIQQFEQVYTPLIVGKTLPEGAAINQYVFNLAMKGFRTYRVIDCLGDETADYIDFNGRTSYTDTLHVPMQDRLCLQFQVKMRHLYLLPTFEKVLLDYLNADPVLQQTYEPYMKNLREEVAFNHRQAQKLDSLTSSYYFHPVSNAAPMNYEGNGVNFYGDRRIRLFLDKIYEQHAHVQRMDQRLQLATAPVTLENHFTVDPTPLNGRRKFMVMFFLLGWCGACLLAELIDSRKKIIAWLKK